MVSKKELYIGCLLGGAIGDALGYPIEFKRLKAINEQYGKEGISSLKEAGSPALISDDTQMTLFAANALILANGSVELAKSMLQESYKEWAATQGVLRLNHVPKMWIFDDRRLHEWRAPGSTCVSSIIGQPVGGWVFPKNTSKGCGTVMRAAPFGLWAHCANTSGDIARYDARMTHGHEMAAVASEYLARFIYNIVNREYTDNLRLEEVLFGNFPSSEKPCYVELNRRLDIAIKTAIDRSISDQSGVRRLGFGWTADEALAIAVFCAVRYQNDFKAGVKAAVNHGGDSDSTGAICGNILGAWLGVTEVKNSIDVENLELTDLIQRVAEELYNNSCVHTVNK